MDFGLSGKRVQSIKNVSSLGLVGVCDDFDVAARLIVPSQVLLVALAWHSGQRPSPLSNQSTLSYGSLL